MPISHHFTSNGRRFTVECNNRTARQIQTAARLGRKAAANGDITVKLADDGPDVAPDIMQRACADALAALMNVQV
jgi:hypothetical protein